MSTDKLHDAVCQAVSIMNASPDILRSEDGCNARNILRQALIDYADDFMEQPVTEQEREAIAHKHRSKR